MDKATDNSTYMRMMTAETHASSSSPLVYTCPTQPSTFHCMKGYRQITAAFDNTPYESSPSSNYTTIKQEPLDYGTTCDNPYEQGKPFKANYDIQFFLFQVHPILRRQSQRVFDDSNI